MLSYWEKSEMLDYDLLVLGGGITGMFCALTYRNKYPNARIAILERGLFPSGASTKNAGFACFGTLTELLEDRKSMEDAAMIDLLQLRLNGLNLLRETLGDELMDYRPFGGHELFFEDTPVEFEKMDELNSLLYPIFNKNIFSLNNSKIETFGFEKNQIKHLIENPFEGQIHTGKMMNALRDKVNRGNIFFFTQTEVSGFSKNNQGNLLEIQIKGQTLRFKTRKLAICTNAFSLNILPHIDMNPGRGMVLLTNPIDNLKLKGTFNYNAGYYYFRNIENRILLGGGRALDFKTETTATFGINPLIKEKLVADLRSFILPEQPFEIEMEWSGIMGFGKSKMPIVKKEGDNVALGIRLGGMGIAIGSKIGEATARLLFD